MRPPGYSTCWSSQGAASCGHTDNWDQGPLLGPSTFSKGPITSLLPAEPLSGSWGWGRAVAACRNPPNPPGMPILPQPRATTPGHIVTPRTPGSGVCLSQLLQGTLPGTATSSDSSTLKGEEKKKEEKSVLKSKAGFFALACSRGRHGLCTE